MQSAARERPGCERCGVTHVARAKSGLSMAGKHRLRPTCLVISDVATTLHTL